MLNPQLLKINDTNPVKQLMTNDFNETGAFPSSTNNRNRGTHHHNFGDEHLQMWTEPREVDGVEVIDQTWPRLGAQGDESKKICDFQVLENQQITRTYQDSSKQE